MRRVASGALPCLSMNRSEGDGSVSDSGAGTTRRELPSDAQSLAPMGEAFERAIDSGLTELGIADGPAGAQRARRSYEAHARLLRDWGAVINLTAIREPEDVARRHVCDSLSAVPHLAGQVRPEMSLLDIGSGGGYPGLPLAAALPLTRVGLLDSVTKKARFLAVAAAAVRLALVEDDAVKQISGPGGAQVPHEAAAGASSTAPLIEALAERAEDLAEEPEHRGTWDVVTARAVGSLAEVVELGMPLASEGGVVVAWKREEERDGLLAELRRAGSIIRATGGGRPEVLAVDVPSLPGHRLVMVPKEQPTPASYPRPAGVRRRRR